MTDRPRTARARIARSAATLVCALLVYYAAPLRAISEVPDVIRVGIVLVGLLGLVWLVIRQARLYVAGPAQTDNRMLGILAILYIVVVVFAISYYLIELRAPGQFDGLSSRTDALYYTVVTLGTVGYGDIHAVGQFARIATMVQITFDLVVIGLLFSVASSHISQRMAEARARHR